MSLFSQRKGLKPASKAIQRESIDEETRNALWSILWSYYQLYHRTEGFHGYRPHEDRLMALARAYWTVFFKKPIDTLPDFGDLIDKCRAFFYNTTWNEVLDFLEFTTNEVGEPIGNTLRLKFNDALEKESCAYRFVGTIVTELTSASEIQAIDDAIGDASKETADHLKKALQFLSDRKAPDYQNSIKESVSAIEAAAREFSGNKSATLSDALKMLSKQNALHPALLKMLMDLYGYAGDEGGVRHANKESAKTVSQAEARLIMVIAAATCGYFKAKT